MVLFTVVLLVLYQSISHPGIFLTISVVDFLYACSLCFNKGSPRFYGAKISHNVRACVNYSAHGRSRSRGNMPNRVVIFMLVCFQI